jgi:PKD repeat protein
LEVTSNTTSGSISGGIGKFINILDTPISVPPPYAYFTCEQDQLDPFKYTFDASLTVTSVPIINYRWDFARCGLIVSPPYAVTIEGIDKVNVMNIFPRPGEYCVTLTVTDHDGLEDSIEKSIIIPGPTTTDMPETTAICPDTETCECLRYWHLVLDGFCSTPFNCSEC